MTQKHFRFFRDFGLFLCQHHLHAVLLTAGLLLLGTVSFSFQTDESNSKASPSHTSSSSPSPSPSTSQATFGEDDPVVLFANTIPAKTTVEGKVVGVTDGDTLTLLINQTQYKIRLQGIDAPEKEQPFGTQSKKALADKVFGKVVKVASDGPDKYQRTLGIVYCDGVGCVNAAMVRDGMAWHYKEYSSNKTLAKAEEDARAKKVGLWSASETPIAPWDWRHGRQNRNHENQAANNDPFAVGQPLDKVQKVEQYKEAGENDLAGNTKPKADTNPNANENAKTNPNANANANAEGKYWMTTSSHKRHNENCRYYGNSKGRPCGPDEGIPCKICGG